MTSNPEVRPSAASPRPRVRTVLLAAAALGATVAPLSLHAQRVTLGGQLRPRTELLHPVELRTGSGSESDRTEIFTSMRTRLSALVEWERSDITGFVQLQDVRLFGEEGSTLGDFSADGLDMHQAWVQLGDFDDGLGLRVGRQELALGEERLIGAVDWTQQARAFDGARGHLERGLLGLDVFAFQTREILGAANNDQFGFLGLYGTLDLGSERLLDLYLLLRTESETVRSTHEGTVGGRYAARTGRIRYRLEAAHQFGDRQDFDVSAHMVAASLGVDVGRDAGTVTLWYDRLSGDEEARRPDGAFNTLFATNHAFYGIADLFLDVPGDTFDRGLEDMAVKSAWNATDDLRFTVDLHRFEALHATSEFSPVGEATHLGEELDITVTRALDTGVRLGGGFAYVFAGEALGPVRRIENDPQGLEDDVVFGYLMLDLVF